MDVTVEKLSIIELEEKDVFSWPIWEKEASRFDWHYDDRERCYFLEGDVVVEYGNGKSVKFGKGDFVTFPKGLDCVWIVKKVVKKHYNFG